MNVDLPNVNYYITSRTQSKIQEVQISNEQLTQ